MSPSTVSSLLAFAVATRWFAIPVLVLLGLGLFAVLNLKTRLGWAAMPVVPLFGLLGVANLAWAPDFNSRYVYEHGVQGSATVIQVVPTGTVLNDVTVMEHQVLLKLADGKTLETSFRSSDGNVYPEPSRPYLLPGVGQPFTVRYVPGAEHNFVIDAADNSSAYTRQIQCAQLLQDVGAAQAKYSFDGTSPQFKQELQRNLRAYVDAPCAEPAMKNAFEMLLTQLE